MASEAGKVHPENKGFLDNTRFLRDPVSRGMLFCMLSEDAWEKSEAKANLSRHEADALYGALTQWKRLIGMPENEPPDREMFRKEFPLVKQKLEERLGKLYALADKVDKVHKDRTISKVVTSFIKFMCSILHNFGLFLEPVAAGANLGLLIAGLCMEVLPAVISIFTSIREYSSNESAKAEVSQLLSTGINKGNGIREFLSVVAPQMFHLGKVITIVKNVWAYMLATGTPPSVDKAKVFETIENVFEKSSREQQKACGGTVLAMIPNALSAGFTILKETIALLKEAVPLYKGSKATLAEEFRQQAQELETRLKELRQILEEAEENTRRDDSAPGGGPC